MAAPFSLVPIDLNTGAICRSSRSQVPLKVRQLAEFGSIGGCQAAALIGVAPMARDNGTRQGARHVAGGRRRPRVVLYMAALTATSHNPQMIALYRRLRERGKHHNVALVAVMRKLIVTANALLRDGRTWSERAPA